MVFTSSAEQREILALSFEQTEGSYIYYHNRWSPGIPVTGEEREEYLRISVFGSRRAWRKSIKGRETLPPRAYWPLARKLLRAMPLQMAVLSLIFGLSFMLAGLNEPRLIFAGIYFAGGTAMLAFAGSAAIARFARSDHSVR